MSHDTKESYCASPSLSAGELSLPPNFQKGGGGLDRTSTFRGRLLGKREMTFFKEGVVLDSLSIYKGRGGGLGKKEGGGVFEGG